jgi:hypothetical protein
VGLDHEVEFYGASTGTPGMPLPRLERRVIQNIYGKPVHKACGGNLDVSRHDTCTEGFTMVCLKCGKEICADV